VISDDLKPYRHLRAAMHLTGPMGLCFHRAAALVLDLPPATLAVGTLPAATSNPDVDDPAHSNVDFIHAWVEVRDKYVLAPTLIERSEALGTPWITLKSEYYYANRPRDIHFMTRGQLKKLSREYGLSAHLKRGDPLTNGASFGDIILKAMGVKFLVGKRGGVLPAPRRTRDEQISMP
jgi:hypothetical protein